jgi:hypothetical protein
MRNWLKKLQGLGEPKPEVKPVYTGLHGNRETIDTLARTLDVEAFKDYHPDAAIGIEVNTLFPTLSDYCHEMRQIALRVLNDTRIQSSWADQEWQVRAFGTFLSTNNNFYVDPYEVVCNFKDEVLILASLLHKLDRAKHGVDQYNRRLLTKFVLSVEAILNALVTISLELSPQD